MTSKSSPIVEPKRGVKKIRLDVVRESCSVWMNRLYRVTQNYFEKIKSSLSDRESKDEFFLKARVLILIKVFTRYCENRKRAIYSETSDSLVEMLNRRNDEFTRHFIIIQIASLFILNLYDSKRKS